MAEEEAWAAKYSLSKLLGGGQAQLTGFNWKATKCISSSKLSTQATPLLQLSLSLTHPDGKEATQHLELTAEELKEFLATVSAASATLL